MKNFEKRLAKLEVLAEKIKDSSIPLDEAVSVFEEGIALSRALKEELDTLQRRVDIILNDPEDSGVARIAKFDEGEDPTEN